jgi:uncharacterized protein (UPF0335 family)
MDIQELNEIQKEYKDVCNKLQRLQGEENQLLQEKEQILTLLKENGFNSKEELETKLAGLNVDANGLVISIKEDLK